MTVEKRRIQVERRFGNGHLIVTPTSASSIYNHCGSRAILGLHVNGKKLFFVCCLSLYWWKLLSFFGTYALDISSLTSSIKYISEKYKPLRLCHILRYAVQGLNGAMNWSHRSTAIDPFRSPGQNQISRRPHNHLRSCLSSLYVLLRMPRKKNLTLEEESNLIIRWRETCMF